MSIAVRTGARSSLGMSLPSLSALEVQALEVPGLAWRFSARDLDPTGRGVSYRDGVGPGVFTSQGAVFHGTVGAPARPAARFNGSAPAACVGQVMIPSSYTLYCLVTPNADASFQTLAASRTSTGDRAWLVSDVNRRLRLIHGGGEVISPTTYTSSQPYLAIAAYNQASGKGSVGLNTLNNFATGDLIAHKAELASAVGGILNAGGAGTNNMNGWIEEVWAFEGSHVQPGLEHYREAVGAFLAGRAGIALA
ncbi:hypothetical protein [Brevundimonas sp.]|uniref:hypothetical protein n=1 Tax=Brevundimonas sp. TaxID=1871086 RepID=UPI003D6C7695